MRKVAEWIAKHDDANIPDGVKLRLWAKCDGHCQNCKRKMMAGEVKHFDHITPLADGGKHAESNLQVLCVPCHGDKTSGEASARAKVRSKAKAVLGIKQPKGNIKSPGLPKTSKARPASSKPMPPRVKDVYGRSIQRNQP